MGTRGIPASYGGFETFYENLGPGLAARGHDVSVYIRPHAVGVHEGRSYRGVRLVALPSLRTKHLETITHTLLSVLHGLAGRYDVVYICGVGNTPLAWIPRLARAQVVLNVDSSDWKRKKWGRGAALYLRWTERFAARAANVIVADSQAIQARYRDEQGVQARFFPYGANLVDSAGVETLQRFGLRPRGYVLWVGRLEPEARVEELILAFLSLGQGNLKLVIVGDAPYSQEYGQRLHALATADVVFTGYQFREAYRELGYHALAFVQTSPTSGTSPALLDQMAAGGLVIARGTATNLEVIGDAGVAYDPEDGVAGLAAALQRVIIEPDWAEDLRATARHRVATVYSWDRIIDDYELLFKELVAGVPPTQESG
jgi:glycosyltransferase involved in cell wall biosynthesis